MSEEIKFNAEEVLQRLAPKYLEELEEKFTCQVIKELDWSLQDKIGKLTAQFFNEHISKELEAKFSEMKPQIVNEIAKGIVKTCEILAEKMIETAVKNLSISYNASEIFGKLFK